MLEMCISGMSFYHELDFSPKEIVTTILTIHFDFNENNLVHKI